MSWAVGYDTDWQRDIGYGVPAVCDHPFCAEEIDRGLAYRCGGTYTDQGCGLFFCSTHMLVPICRRCELDLEPFEPKPDLVKWMLHKLRDPSWEQWRDDNPKEVAQLHARLLDAVNEPSDEGD